MKNNTLTLTIIASMHANYSESLGNIASVQKINFNNKQYAIRTKESIKNAIMRQSGFYDDLRTIVDGATQKMVDENNNIATSRALEGGYMTTKPQTYKRNSSFYVTDAVAAIPFSIDTRFCNNLSMAENYAMLNNLNTNDDAKKTGLMPYQYEIDTELRTYSLTIDLEAIGVDKNFDIEVNTEEKIYRVNALLDAIRDLPLVVKGFLDNSEPLFIIGGLCNNKTHVFNNVIRIKDNKICATSSLIGKMEKYNAKAALVEGIFDNDTEIKTKLNTIDMDEFFDNLKEEVRENYCD